MKMRCFLNFVSLFLIVFSCDTKPNEIRENSLSSNIEEQRDNNFFDIKRGTNISHWLSQSKKRGEERKAYFTQEDVNYLASIGFDHLRIPIDEEQMWDEDGVKQEEAFKLLHDAIGWCKEAKLKVLVDLHILRSHHFNAANDGGNNTLFTSTDSQEQFFQCWRELSGELGKYPLDFLAYELMNEPVAENAEDWNGLVGKCLGVVRLLEPERKVFIGSNEWQSVFEMDKLKVPENDPNIVLSFHFYHPMELTHFKTSWTPIGRYKGQVNYPGIVVSKQDIKTQSLEVQKMMGTDNILYNKDSIEKAIEKPLLKAKETGL